MFESFTFKSMSWSQKCKYFTGGTICEYNAKKYGKEVFLI